MARPQAPPLEVARWADGEWVRAGDHVAAEEPLQISVDGRPWTVVMRTPGADVELALGLLFAERVIHQVADVRAVTTSAESEAAAASFPVERSLVESNAIDVRLRRGTQPAPRTLGISSACGICGQTTLEDLAALLEPLPARTWIRADALPALAGRLRGGQGLFDQTGGLHAAGLFSENGDPVVIREDVGRHNAVDKVVGRALLDGVDTGRTVLAVSGRVGFEVAQKTIAAGIPVLVAIGAPSSLAVAAARRFNLTLVGFLKAGGFNVYSAAERFSSR